MIRIAQDQSLQSAQRQNDLHSQLLQSDLWLDTARSRCGLHFGRRVCADPHPGGSKSKPGQHALEH